MHYLQGRFKSCKIRKANCFCGTLFKIPALRFKSKHQIEFNLILVNPLIFCMQNISALISVIYMRIERDSDFTCYTPTISVSILLEIKSIILTLCVEVNLVMYSMYHTHIALQQNICCGVLETRACP